MCPPLRRRRLCHGGASRSTDTAIGDVRRHVRRFGWSRFVRLRQPSRVPSLSSDSSPATSTLNSAPLNSDRDRVLEATDLVALVAEDLALEPKGAEYVGLCPFHDDSRPSFYVNPLKQRYFCHACPTSGNAIDFLMRHHGLEFPEVLKLLADRAGIQLTRRGRSDDDGTTTRTLVRRANRLADGFFRRQLLDPDAGTSAREILDARGISAELAEAFGLGYAPDAWTTLVDRVEDATRKGHAADGDPLPDLKVFEQVGLVRTSSRGTPIDGFRNRLIFPIRDEFGQTIAFGARKVAAEDEPKYLNSPESEVFVKGRTLYGLDLAKRGIMKSGVAIVCEGYTDVIALHGHGFDNAVAALGTSLTRDHAEKLSKLGHTVILLFDGDAAGQRAAERAVEVFFSTDIDIRFCSLPDGLDPDECLRAEDGPARFQAALDEAPDALEALVADVRARLQETRGVTPRQRIVDELLRRLNQLGLGGVAGVRRLFVLDQLAVMLDVPVAMLQGQAEGVSTVRRTTETTETSAPDATDASEPALQRAPFRRRQAEEGLLRLVLADRALLRSIPEKAESVSAPIDRFSASDFDDELCRHGWEILVVAERDGDIAPDGHDLIKTASTPAAEPQLLEIYIHGIRELHHGGIDPVDAIVQAMLDLESAIERDRRIADRVALSQESVESAQDAAAALERLRNAGHEPAAIAHRRSGRVTARPESAAQNHLTRSDDSERESSESSLSSQ